MAIPQLVLAICQRTNAKRAAKATTRSYGRSTLAMGGLAWCLLAAQVASTQELVMPGMAPTGVDHGAAPVTDFGGVNFFSQDLGTVLRLRYNTESYGQNDHGNFDIGTMQVVSFDDAIAFFDGQVTMNDVQGVGFNLGVGFRWMTYPPYSLDTGRVQGISIWADGTSTEAGNFYPQFGISCESLGETWDFRVNAYTPLGPQDQTGDFEPTGEIGFREFSIAQLTEAVVDSSFYAAELEVARRLGAQRDAWAFAGPYVLANDDDDSPGFRTGLRGYAYPDLLLQIAISNDEIFDTNATFSVVWFTGRTRTDFTPAGGVADRLREPVMRNDYVVLAQSTTQGGIPLTAPDGSDLRIVHVNSAAAPGGDGSFENPFDMLSDVNGAGSQAGDIILAHAESSFSGDVSAILKNNQRLLGEGNGMEFTVATAEEGTLVIPETIAGARNADRPMILAAIGDAIVLADANEVANFDVDGQNVTTRAIASPAAGAGNPNLHDLAISNTTGNAIELTALDFIDTDDVDGDGNTTERLVRGNVTIDDMTFDNVGGNDIDITATAVDVTQAGVELQEAISITNVTSNNGDGRSIVVRNTHSGAGRTTTLSNFTYNGGTTSQGAIQLVNFDGTFTGSSSTLTGGAATGQGVQILGDSDGTITFQDSVAFNNLGGTAFDINGDSAGVNQFGATLVVNSDIDNNAGLSVSARGIGAGSATFNGGITDSGDGIRADSNGGGLLLFTGDLDLDTDDSAAVLLTNNANTDIDFTGVVDINTTSGDGFVATGGGNLAVNNTGNSVRTTTGQVVRITDMTIDTTGANFADVNRSAAAATSALQLEDNTGGPITFGAPTDAAPGDGGTLQGGNANTVVIRNSSETAITGLIINNAAGQSGVFVDKDNNNAMTVDISDTQINDGAVGIDVDGGGTTGALTMTVNDTEILGATDAGMDFNDVDAGSVIVNNATIDGENTPASHGVRIDGSNAAFTFDSSTEITRSGDTDFEVNGGNGNITYNGSIVNSTATNAGDTAGNSVTIRQRTGGTVTFGSTSTINDDNLGIIVQSNSAGTVNFQGDNDLDTGGLTALTVTGNTGGTYNFNNFDITTTSGTGVSISGNSASTNINFNGLDIAASTTGRGFHAAGPGTLTVSGADNTISTENGIALDVQDMTVGAAGLQFLSVNVADGSSNAIILEDLTGGLVLIGSPAGAANSGGTLTTADEAIILRNVENADLNNVRIASAGNNAVLIEHTAAATTAMDITFDGLNLDSTTGTGMSVSGANNDNAFNLRLLNGDLENNVAIAITGAGSFGLLVDSTDINETGADIAFGLTFSGGATDGDVTFRNGNNFVADTAQALFIDSFGNTFKDVKVLVADSTFLTNGAPAAAQIESHGNTLMQTTVQGNSFASSGAALYDLEIRSGNTATARMRLNLGGDDPTDFNSANGAGRMLVEEVGTSDFDIFERDDTITADTRNNDPVDALPNDAAFENLAMPPTPPTVP